MLQSHLDILMMDSVAVLLILQTPYDMGHICSTLKVYTISRRYS